MATETKPDWCPECGHLTGMDWEASARRNGDLFARELARSRKLIEALESLEQRLVDVEEALDNYADADEPTPGRMIPNPAMRAAYDVREMLEIVRRDW